MRKIVIIVILCFVIFFIVGCTTNENYEVDKDSKVLIKGYYEQPMSMQEEETVILEGGLQGEFVEIVVQGEIKHFEHVSLEWDANNNELVEKEVINSFDKLVDQIIVIKTYMAEGIPSEKIKWQSTSGKAYEFVIREHALDGENDNVAEFVLE